MFGGDAHKQGVGTLTPESGVRNRDVQLIQTVHLKLDQTPYFVWNQSFT